MNILLWIMAGLAAYAVIGLAIGWRIYNLILLADYKKTLQEWDRTTSFHREFYKESYDAETLEEAAFQRAKTFGTGQRATAEGVFWPFVGVWQWIYLEFAMHGKRIMPKNLVEKEIAKVASKRKELAALKILIADAKAAGIDVTGLEEIVKTKRLESQI